MLVRELVEIVGEEIVIRIPIDALTVAAPIAWETMRGGSSQELRILDQSRFAEELVRELRKESETGSTLVTNILDKAVCDAVEWGAEGCELSRPHAA